MRPIGYWLDRTDLAFTTTMNAMLAGAGLTRLAWQVLNVVEADPRATDTARLAPPGSASVSPPSARPPPPASRPRSAGPRSAPWSG
ncbi:hypothetical protein ACFZCK_28520 [Kitasatospora purpeofusca]|uniref:hypothetical protein n=1 Tax=Kitasatospora purpeofusca TaxID=67352 RepID=UPI0036E446D7